jgi:hypothetical protein
VETALEPTALRRIAKTGVRALYSLGLPVRNLDKRRRALDEYRARYRSADAIPYFIGIWDTVAALGWAHFTLSKLRKLVPILAVDYDMHFVQNIPFARHAMAIDEYRKDFVRVPWGGSGTVSDEVIKGVPRFAQVWFAGNHSDIGGSYPENESRLSDISLKWMANFVVEQLPEFETRILINRELLNLYPSCDGMMHDELMVGHGPGHKIHFWAAGDRKVDPGGELHESVLERLQLPRVRNFIGYGLYRPKSLAEHPRAKPFYQERNGEHQ